MGPPGVGKSYFTWEFGPFNGRNKHFPRHVPAFDIVFAGHSIVTTLRNFLLFLPKHV